jgi:hypothetical protein
MDGIHAIEEKTFAGSLEATEFPRKAINKHEINLKEFT